MGSPSGLPLLRGLDMPITDEMKKAGIEILKLGLDMEETVEKLYRAMRDAKQREAIADYRSKYGYVRE